MPYNDKLFVLRLLIEAMINYLKSYKQMIFIE